MKNWKLKSAMSVVLVLVLVLSMVACTQSPSTKSPNAGESVTSTGSSESSEATTNTVNRGTKIGIMCSPLSWGEENYRMVQKYVAKYGEDRFIINTIPEDADLQTCVSLTTKMASDPECGVIIYNEAVPGAIASLKAAREINPDLLLFAINPYEEPIEMSAVADFACLQAVEGFGTAVADAANEKGLEVVVMEAPADSLGSTRVQRRVAALESRCEEYGIKFILTSLPNETDPNTRPALEQAAKEDVYNKINEYGEKVGFFPHTSFAYVPQLTAILDEKQGYLICPADPGPFSPSYSDVFKVSAPDDHILDIPWTNKAIADKIEEIGMVGHFGNWSFAYLSSFMAASIEYGMAYQEGSLEKGDVGAWMQYFKDVNGITDEDYSYIPFEANGTTYNNFVLVNGIIKWYGENLGVD